MINQYWLLKSEPQTYSIDDLVQAPQQIGHWEGVRNYQARNFLRDMRLNDLAFFYHSSCKTPGIVGIVKIVRAGYPDITALDPASQYFDPKSSVQNPRWYQVDVQLVKKLQRIITLGELRQHPPLENMLLLRQGNRLSVMPVSLNEWNVINSLSLQP